MFCPTTPEEPHEVAIYNHKWWGRDITKINLVPGLAVLIMVLDEEILNLSGQRLSV